MWEVSVPFECHMQCLLVTGFALPSCVGSATIPYSSWHSAWWWLMGNLSPVVIAFSPLFSLFNLKKYTFVLFVFYISILILIFNFFFIFVLGSFIEVLFFFFQFNPLIRICHILFFSIWSLFFWFFLLSPFVKVLLVFNFILQSKFMVYYFFSNLDSILLICFSFC